MFSYMKGQGRRAWLYDKRVNRERERKGAQAYHHNPSPLQPTVNTQIIPTGLSLKTPPVQATDSCAKYIVLKHCKTAFDTQGCYDLCGRDSKIVSSDIWLL